jgi:hypothetical protein
MFINFSRIKRYIKIRSEKLKRGFKYGTWAMKSKDPRDRMLIKIVKSYLERMDTFVRYSPNSNKIYLHTKDKKYIIVFDRYSIKLTNHKNFYFCGLKESVASEIIKCTFDRLEKEQEELEAQIYYNEKEFINEIFDNISKIPKK